jgi:hypothetical protein
MAAGNAGIGDRDLQGFKHFRSLRKLLFRLHEVGTKRDAAGNRQLHMDQYCVLVLLWLFVCAQHNHPVAAGVMP